VSLLEGEQWRIEEGDVRSVLRTLPDQSVQCCVTSPPYWGMRKYGTTPQVWGGRDDCDHQWGAPERAPLANSLKGPNSEQWLNGAAADSRTKETGPFCTECGAWLGELGSEPTPQLYVQHMVLVFREVRRVLRKDGILWLNLGDSYASPGMASPSDRTRARGSKQEGKHVEFDRHANRGNFKGWKRKELLGMPWRVAFALQEDGWMLRCDVIWQKPRALPESVGDRPSRIHEYIFMFVRQGKYYYDQDAVRTRLARKTFTTFGTKRTATGNGGVEAHRVKSQNMRGIERWPKLGPDGEPLGANLRSVWTVTPGKYTDDHYASYPGKVIEPCVRSSTRQEDIVLDPFSGTATTGEVALKHARRYFGIELHTGWAETGRQRLRRVRPVQLPLLHGDMYQLNEEVADVQVS
jgi:DNA modification methylase